MYFNGSRWHETLRVRVVVTANEQRASSSNSVRGMSTRRQVFGSSAGTERPAVRDAGDRFGRADFPPREKVRQWRVADNDFTDAWVCVRLVRKRPKTRERAVYEAAKYADQRVKRVNGEKKMNKIRKMSLRVRVRVTAHNTNID